MRCISVQQIVRSDIQAGRKILQQLNRAAAASRFNFCKMVRTNVQHYTQLFLWAAHGVLSAFNAFQAIFPLAQLKYAPWRYYSKQFYHCKALKPTILAIKLLIFSVIYFEGCSLLLRSSSILQINVLFSERPLIRKSLLIPIASDRRPKWSTPKLRCPFSNARSCCTEISASAASRSYVQPFSRRLPRILFPTCTLS